MQSSRLIEGEKKYEKYFTKAANTQKSHLQEIVSPMNPAAVGPRAGPANGATVKTAMALPRIFASQMSDINALSVCKLIITQKMAEKTNPEFVRGAAANVPPRNRNIKIEDVFLARAPPIMKH